MLLRKCFRPLLLTVICLWVLVPFYFLVVVSLTPVGTLVNGFSHLPNGLSTHNYNDVLAGVNRIWGALGNSVIVTAGATVVALSAGVPAAYGLSHLKAIRFWRGTYLAFFVLRGVPPISLVIPYFVIFARLNLRDNLFGLILALVPLALPYCVWTLRVVFDQIPDEIEDAASIDGAGVFRTFAFVVLPVARTSVIAVGTLSALLVYVDYLVVSTLAGPSTFTFPVYVTGFQQDQLSLVGALSAASIIGALPMLALFVFSQRYMTRLAAAGIH